MTVLERRVALMRRYGLLLPPGDLFGRTGDDVTRKGAKRSGYKADDYGEGKADARARLHELLLAEEEGRVAADLERLKGGRGGRG